MRFCRFGEGRLGLIEGPSVRDVTAALDVLPSCRYPLPNYDLLIAHLDQVSSRARELAPQVQPLPLAGVKLLSPVANPGKIIAAPVNYKKHAQEVRENPALHNNNPALLQSIQTIGLFLKATSSLAGPAEGIQLRRLDRRNDHEVELAFVVGKSGYNIPRAEALKYVAGYSIGLDITIRGSEDRSFRKSPDTYSVLGPWLVTPDEIPDPGRLDLSITVNGEVRQQSNTDNMILGVAELIEMASSFYTLHPGDIFLTGTPEGVSQIVPGDTIVATVESIGAMEVSVHAAQTTHASA
ncbi:MAG TPA: fumarylacetoacetate hydrolase family protein [Bryobacteraceae bacterium]|jgi:2-keto-4-pentenoate hydratase/2-oxohepta-3-ene-1,7-dioic acid hydratase in catechol pathway